MRKIFIDGGAHCGCSRRHFRKEYDPTNEWEIFSFEPNPLMQQYCGDLIQKALWVHNKKTTLYRYYKSGGSTINISKNNLLSHRRRELAGIFAREDDEFIPKMVYDEIECQCIDIDEFIRQNFSNNDLIYLKLDVEGSEYGILEHLLEKNTMQYIDKLFIEWHGIRRNVVIKNQNVNMVRKGDPDLTEKIQTLKIPIDDTWNAMKVDLCRFPR